MENILNKLFYLHIYATILVNTFSFSASSENVCYKSDHSGKVYICKNVTSIKSFLRELRPDVRNLTLLHSSITDKHLDNDNSTSNIMFNFLESVVIHHCQLNKGFLDWLNIQDKLKHIEFINSSTTFTMSYPRVYLRAADLNFLSPSLIAIKIQHCNIIKLEVPSLLEKQSVDILSVDISNNKVECQENFIWLLELSRKSNKVKIENNFCFIKQITLDVPYAMVNSFSNKPFKSVVMYQEEALMNCPEGCICDLLGMVTVSRPQLVVECTGLNITELPKVIPNGTLRCDFAFNFIKDISPIYTNRMYSTVQFFNFTYNYISYLDPFMLSLVLQTEKRGLDFGLFLAHNRLTQFPSGIVKQVYDILKDRTRYLPVITLHGNPWDCSCDSIRPFQTLINEYMLKHNGVKDIKCVNDGSYTSDKSIVDLDVGSLCDKNPTMDIMDIFNIILFVVFTLLILSFAYNFRQYRKSHKLPWIVTKFKF